MVITSAEVRGEEVLCQGLFLKKKTVKQTGRDSVFWNGWVARAWSSLHCLVYFPEGLKHFMIFFGGGAGQSVNTVPHYTNYAVELPTFGKITGSAYPECTG